MKNLFSLPLLLLASAALASMPPENKNSVTQALQSKPAEQGKQQEHNTDAAAQKANVRGLWDIPNPDEMVELNFKDTELANFIQWIENLFKVTFILDDAIKPAPQGGKSVLGTKITFKTHQPITRQQVGEIFDTFLDIAGLARAQGPAPRVYRITTTNPQSPLSVNKASLPTFFGTEEALLPKGEQRIRYVYFIQNTGFDVIKNIADQMRSSTSTLIPIPDLRALLITDKAANIKSMLQIIAELDKVNLPETLSIIRLRHTDAKKIADLYKKLVEAESQQGMAARLAGAGKPSQQFLFAAGTRVIAEPRSNALILLGTRDSIMRIEEFIVKHLDTKDDRSYSPLHIHQLRFVDADTVASILNEVVKFKTDTDAAKFGGVRDGDKYLKSVSIIAEKTSNSLIINASHDEDQKIFELLQKIDVEQPQVAMKVLILNIDVNDDKQLGVQIRDRVTTPDPNGILGKNVNFQTSGLFGSTSGVGTPIVENTTGSGATRLLGDLIKLASAGTIGSTLLTLGSDAYGVWGLLQVLEKKTRVSVVANPFLVATNKYPAFVSIGETRRAQTATIVGAKDTATFDDTKATLDVRVTPQISLDGLITLEVYVTLQQFTSTSPTDPNRTEKTIKTTVIVSDNEVLALGGLIKDTTEEAQTKVPVLGDIPLIGWLFKNKAKTVRRQSLVILIAPEIIPANSNVVSDQYTNIKLNDAKDMILGMKRDYEARDPIHRWFFKDASQDDSKIIDEYVGDNKEYTAIEQQQLEDANKIGNRSLHRRKKRLADMIKGAE